MDALVLLVAFLGLAALVLAASVRLGILVGRRLDRFIEFRAAAVGPDGLTASEDAAHSARRSDAATDNVDQQEDRGD